MRSQQRQLISRGQGGLRRQGGVSWMPNRRVFQSGSCVEHADQSRKMVVDKHPQDYAACR